jgi:hypothetical protein
LTFSWYFDFKNDLKTIKVRKLSELKIRKQEGEPKTNL